LEQRTQDLTLTFTLLSLYEKYLIYNTRARSSALLQDRKTSSRTPSALWNKPQNSAQTASAAF
jgi:hypothetical protein